ncbi:MAG: hypothetical protein KKA84_00010 [Bacteroidetes bacterium]|nr:hypothetical protein [Bacteroidota bacterium]
MKVSITGIINILILVFVLQLTGYSQVREYKIHDRGMLHETVFNTGTIGRPWIYGAGGETTNLPVFEWPPRSKTVINGIEYSGQHNMIGAGVYVTANEKGSPGWDNRIFSFCGGIGSGSGAELPLGRWSFPLSLEEIENFPLLDDGSLNPNYNPDEAEEIIIAKWATSTGITVTRTSRAWSYPDYDDMIIYEYELEYTGDTNGSPESIERTADLVDVLFSVNYGFSPSMLGYQRHYGEWKYEGGMWRGDNRHTFDPDYWLSFSTTTHTGAADNGVGNLMAKPEPNIDLFREFAETGKNGGGLLSPQTPGYCWLYWDIDHLAIADPDNLAVNETEYFSGNYALKNANGQYFETDENKHIPQPWQMKGDSGNTRPDKMEDRATTLDERWWTVYGELGTPAGVPSDGGRFVLPDGKKWLGRARFEWDESYNGVMLINGFGPYVMSLGDKLQFAYAEVVGYGGTAGKTACGGQTDNQFFRIRDLNKRVVVNGEVVTEHYLDDYGYPDYVNSEVISVNQVAHKAHEAYLGEEIPYDANRMGPARGFKPTLAKANVGAFQGMLFPEYYPKPSENTMKYKIPVRVPAPVINVENTSIATVMVKWSRAVEEFTHPRLTGNIMGYKVYRSEAGMGPWQLLSEVNSGQVNNENIYEFEDNDETYKLGETRFYSVTSVDNNGKESGRTNITTHIKNVRSVDVMDQVYVVPNPYNGTSGFTGLGQEGKIGFYGLPETCTIRIFSYAGQLIETIEHDDPVFSTEWFQVTRNNQDIASGIYFYVVTTPSDEMAKGKFIIIK